MKAKVNDKSYDLVNSGVSNYDNKLILSIIRGDNIFENVKNAFEEASEIGIIDDDGDFIQKYSGYDKLASITQDENIVIEAAKYDKQGNVISKEIKDTVIVVTLKKEKEEKEEEPQEETDDIDKLKKQLEDNTAKIDYLLMLLE